MEKTPTGVNGLDELLEGGLPRGRLLVLTGSPGTGKTVTALELLARAARRGEIGVFVAFEEGLESIRGNAEAFGWADDLDGDGVHFIDGQVVDGLNSGEAFDLHGLLASLQALDEKTPLDWVVLDGVDVVLNWLTDANSIRREFVRFREWVHERGLHGILTAKRDGIAPEMENTLSYVADVVISLHHQLSGRSALRDIRVEKMRGSAHSSNLNPMAITGDGLNVSSGGSFSLDYEVSNDRVSSGVDALDEMLGGGYYRGSTVLVSGSPGTSKTSLAAAFVHSACQRGERALFMSFDEGRAQIVRNMRSINLDLGAQVDEGSLAIESMRSRAASPEDYVVRIRRWIVERGISCLVVDPVSAFEHAADPGTIERASLAITDVAKARGVTVVLTTLLSNASILESQTTPTGISTVADTWIHLRYLDQGGERNRSLSIVKSRGMNHSRQVRELILSDEGIDLAEVYTAGGEVLMGTLRWEKEREQQQRLRERLVEGERRVAQERAAAAEADARLTAVEQERAKHSAELSRLEDEMRLLREEREAFEQEVRRRRRHEDR